MIIDEPPHWYLPRLANRASVPHSQGRSIKQAPFLLHWDHHCSVIVVKYEDREKEIAQLRRWAPSHTEVSELSEPQHYCRFRCGDAMVRGPKTAGPAVPDAALRRHVLGTSEIWDLESKT